MEKVDTNRAKLKSIKDELKKLDEVMNKLQDKCSLLRKEEKSILVQIIKDEKLLSQNTWSICLSRGGGVSLHSDIESHSLLYELLGDEFWWAEDLFGKHIRISSHDEECQLNIDSWLCNTNKEIFDFIEEYNIKVEVKDQINKANKEIDEIKKTIDILKKWDECLSKEDC